jgi:hypothetical protein
MVRQATMLSYKNAFAMLAAAVLLLSPLPFLMRCRPSAPPTPNPPRKNSPHTKHFSAALPVVILTRGVRISVVALETAASPCGPDHLPDYKHYRL